MTKASNLFNVDGWPSTRATFIWTEHVSTIFFLSPDSSIWGSNCHTYLTQYPQQDRNKGQMTSVHWHIPKHQLDVRPWVCHSTSLDCNLCVKEGSWAGIFLRSSPVPQFYGQVATILLNWERAMYSPLHRGNSTWPVLCSCRSHNTKKKQKQKPSLGLFPGCKCDLQRKLVNFVLNLTAPLTIFQ